MSRSFRLGIFVLSTLGILSVSVFLIGRQVSRFGGTYRVRSQFDNVGGLSEGLSDPLGGTTVVKLFQPVPTWNGPCQRNVPSRRPRWRYHISLPSLVMP